jgi:hypothetical protein
MDNNTTMKGVHIPEDEVTEEATITMKKKATQ